MENGSSWYPKAEVLVTATVGVTANDAAVVVGVADLAVVRPRDLDPAPNQDPVPDPPQKGNPEVVPGKEFSTNFCFAITFNYERF